MCSRSVSGRVWFWKSRNSQLRESGPGQGAGLPELRSASPPSRGWPSWRLYSRTARGWAPAPRHPGVSRCRPATLARPPVRRRPPRQVGKSSRPQTAWKTRKNAPGAPFVRCTARPPGTLSATGTAGRPSAQHVLLWRGSLRKHINAQSHLWQGCGDTEQGCHQEQNGAAGEHYDRLIAEQRQKIELCSAW